MNSRLIQPLDPSIWQKVHSELTQLQSGHHTIWWNRHAGKALAVLLSNAGYSPELQFRELMFFAKVVAPNLGISRETTERDDPWPSFMTDDGTPIEFSWDWGSKDRPPKIRYSVEPVGLDAGTSLDPGNLAGEMLFKEQLLHHYPSMRLEWLVHFERFFGVGKYRGPTFTQDQDDHNSSTFYGFDLSIVATIKVYFFPKMRARAFNQSNIEVLFQAINTAPYITKENLKAASTFQSFCSDMANQAIEYKMLAIDLVDPLKSRLKIYFRCRETTFDSLIRMMTLGGRNRSDSLLQGLRDIEQLWKALFSSNASPDESLGDHCHRTAGILYNVEFRIGDMVPCTKVYLPVRHYSTSDESIIRGLGEYLESHDRGEYMPQYDQAMKTLL